ncbi:pyrroloquinoline quinone biosynthesis peptide chaperone PqqD [Maritimibacter sp. UBA3975]|uniref:pyrroloquinoline quinone biosynthesis peptide chaperone PqqD n=1 Tax=Maritimibacter sp. UBA3975 TaxID=1946833 RepID=UPI000C0B0666|nr:pyrroloquinoline quinone biosynthesis peptide chaperone PqqD [Maritimibacter sp. UBA3975]MAM61569.1 pyrroloquinoline quinone biosynthesis peptide chaperone PqqD [Maritimibacter sp.]|tara:strand:- start:11467 stop:11787 length:321 start_codon:yes stop_codon:yes gene_type:complete
MTGDARAPQRLIVTGEMAVTLPRHVQLRFNKPRDMWLLLAPERVLEPDAIAVTVLQKCDGTRTIRDISQELADIYTAPVETIEADVTAMMQDLADKGFLTEGRTHE